MIIRRKSKKIRIGNVEVGGDAPISVQSMTNTRTQDVNATIKQINELQRVGCDIVRIAVENKEDTKALYKISQSVSLPIIADIQFDYKLALQAIDNNIAGLRLNPGNIKNKKGVREVANIAKERNIPIRIGVNSGSLSKDIIKKYGYGSEALVMQALNEIRLLEEVEFDLIKVSLKSSDILTTIDAYRKIAQRIIYPLHLGLTEAGPRSTGAIKSAITIGILLSEGIGDTIRVSLTDGPVEEVKVANEILKGLGLRGGINLISCPTCSRCKVDLIKIVNKFEKLLTSHFSLLTSHFSIAIMGCAVNGPGEAQHADIGIAYGKEYGVLFKEGKVIKKVNNKELLNELIRNLHEIRINFTTDN